MAALSPDSGYSPRQILILVRNLPIESATMAALRGGSEYLGWGFDRYLTARLIDAVQENTYVQVAANSGKRKPKPPVPTYRPDDKAKAKEKKKTNMFSVMAGQRLAVARRARAARGAKA